MAGEATIGAIRVLLGADTAQFSSALEKAAKELGGFGGKLTTFEKSIVGVFAGIAAGISAALIATINHADEIGKAAQKLGIPVERLSELRYAAELADVSFEQFSKGIVKLNKNITEVAAGGTSIAAVAFQRLGISMKDLKTASPDQVLVKLAEAFSGLQDDASKTALAIALFGKSGAEMIPFLNQGASGIKKLTDEARKLGIVITAEVAAGSEEFNDNLKRIGTSARAVSLQILASEGVLDALNRLSQAFVDTAKDGESLVKVGNFIGSSMKILAFVFEGVRVGLLTLAQPLNAVISALLLMAAGRFSEAFATLKTGFSETNQRLLEFNNTMELTFGANRQGQIDAITQAWEAMDAAAEKASKKKAAPFTGKEVEEAKKFSEALQKIQYQTLETSGAFRDRLAPGFLAAAEGMEHLKGQITIVHGRLVALGPEAEKFNQAMLKLQASKLVEESLPQWQQFQHQVEANTTALTALGYTSEQIAEINAKAAEKAGVSWKNATSDILHNAAAGFAAFAEKNKQFAGIAKGLAIAEAVWNTYLAATKALSAYPPPFGEIAAGAAVLAGLGMVAKIQAQQFARGGSFTVPGGFSGVDSKLMPLALSPGERVDITPSGEARDRRRGSSEIVLSGIGPRDLFTGTMLRDLIEALNQGERDGYRLKFAER
jgi:hypothetical protein